MCSSRFDGAKVVLFFGLVTNNMFFVTICNRFHLRRPRRAPYIQKSYPSRPTDKKAYFQTYGTQRYGMAITGSKGFELLNCTGMHC